MIISSKKKNQRIEAFTDCDKNARCNKDIIKTLENKYLYIDIDGTLAEYRFNGHVSAKDGTSNGQSMYEIQNHVFLYSRPLKTIINILEKAKTRKKCICGAIISPVELMDKLEWLKTNCKGIVFSEYYWFIPNEYWDHFKEFFIINGQKYTEGCNSFSIAGYGHFFKGSKTRIWGHILVNSIHPLEDAVFIDDTLSYLKFAEENGVTAYHISSFLE